MDEFFVWLSVFGTLAVAFALTWVFLGFAIGQNVAIGNVLGSIAGLGLSLAIPVAGLAWVENIETFVLTVTGALVLNFIIQRAIAKRTMTHAGGSNVKSRDVLMLAVIPFLALGMGVFVAFMVALEGFRAAGL